MSASLETGQNNTQKRVRIHTNMNSATDSRQATKAKTPKALALACVQGTAASLHPQVQQIVENYGNKLINLYHKLQQKNVQLSKMETNVDFIPRSARINFEFYVRPDVKQTDEFTAIQTSTTDLIKTFQLNLKEQIIKSMKLDMEHLRNDIDCTICHLIYYITKAFHLQHNPSVINHTTTHTVAFLIAGFGDNLLKHCRLNKTSFKTKFAEVFHDATITNLQSFNTIPASNNVNNANNPLNRYARNLTQPTASQEDPTRIAIDINPATKFIDFLRQTLETLLVTAIDNYNSQVTTNKAASQLEAFATEILHEQATSDTANQMDFSPSVSPQELEELIAKSTSKAVSSLTREIQSLKSKLENSKKNQSNTHSSSNNNSAKNSPQRGRQRASLKKKTPPNNTLRSKSPASKPKRSRSSSTNSNRNKHAGKNNDSKTESGRRKTKNRNSKTSGNRRNSHSSARRN